MELSNPLVLIALAIVANALIAAGNFASLLTLRNQLVSLYMKVAEMDSDNQVDPEEIKAGVDGVKDIIGEFRSRGAAD